MKPLDPNQLGNVFGNAPSYPSSGNYDPNEFYRQWQETCRRNDEMARKHGEAVYNYIQWCKQNNKPVNPMAVCTIV